MNRRMLLVVVGLVAAGAAALGMRSALQSPEGWSEPYAGSERWVSLSPELTEAMFAIGAGGALAGRTSACLAPVTARKLRDVGPPGAPDPQILEELDPSGLMVLQGEAPTGVTDAQEFSWANLDEIAASVRELGDMFSVEDRAEVLATSFENLAKPREEPAGPHTLLVYGLEGDQVHFVARNSVRGHAQATAGLQHPVARDFEQNPKIRMADLAELRPALVLLLTAESVNTERKEALLAPFRALEGLDAELDVVGDPVSMSRGPSVLSLPAILQARAEQLIPPK